MSPQGKRLTMICASLVLLQIMFAVHRFAQGATAPAALRVADCPSGVKVLKMDRPDGRRVLKFDGAFGPEGCGLPLRAMLIKSALRIHLSVSYGMISILRIGSLRSPPPFRLRRTSPYAGGRIKHRETLSS